MKYQKLRRCSFCKFSLARAQDPDGFRATRFAQRGRAENLQEVIIMEATINEKAMRGIERFLERRGMEILETGWAHGNDKIDFIVKDDEDLVFISCTIRTNDGSGLGSKRSTQDVRTRWPCLSAEHGHPGRHHPSRVVSMVFLSEDRALSPPPFLNALSELATTLG